MIELSSRRRQRGLIDAYRFGASAAAGVLDSYTADIFAGCALKLLFSTYSGPLIQVRRSSDNATSDIAFVPSTGLLDTTALATFVGSNSAYITKWYDQSGAGNDMVQATTANQPLIVSAGTYLGTVRFDGSNDYLLSPNSGTPIAFTAFMRLVRQSSATVKVWLEQHSASPGDAAIFYYAATNTIEVNFSQSGNTIARAADYTISATSLMAAMRYTRQQATLANSIAFFLSGARQTFGTTSNAGTSTGTFVAAPWCLGSRLGSLAAQVDVIDLVLYEAAKSDADVTAISVLL